MFTQKSRLTVSHHVPLFDRSRILCIHVATRPSTEPPLVSVFSFFFTSKKASLHPSPLVACFSLLIQARYRYDKISPPFCFLHTLVSIDRPVTRGFKLSRFRTEIIEFSVDRIRVSFPPSRSRFRSYSSHCFFDYVSAQFWGNFVRFCMAIASKRCRVQRRAEIRELYQNAKRNGTAQKGRKLEISMSRSLTRTLTLSQNHCQHSRGKRKIDFKRFNREIVAPTLNL